MKKLILKIKNFFRSGKYKILIENADKIIAVVNILKKVADNPLVIFYTEATKNKVDDRILVMLHYVLPNVLRVLRLAGEADKCMRMSGNAQIQCVANVLMQLSDSQKNIFYREISRRILSVAMGDQHLEFSDTDLDTALQLRYFEMKKAR